MQTLQLFSQTEEIGLHMGCRNVLYRLERDCKQRPNSRGPRVYRLVLESKHAIQ
jgi:hypothetical protein